MMTRFDDGSVGSALLLAVVTVSVLTTTTLGTFAVAYDQLSSTNKVNNASTAKLAADSGLAKLKKNLLGGNVGVTYPDAFNLTDGVAVGNLPADLAPFRPSPRDAVYAVESSVYNLPRCLAVGVLSPWTNDGRYLFKDNNGANPALIFHYANIVNATPYGIIAANTATTSDDNLAAETKAKLLGEVTKLGQFYNPYAPLDKPPSDPSYWTINLNGPKDEFLSRLAEDNQTSFYRQLDFVYAPFLPRFVASAYLDYQNPNGGLQAINADNLRLKFEEVIRQNNFKLWLDGAASDNETQRYGLGDLFNNGNANQDEDSNESRYRLNWLQPSLWNDLPEADGALGYAEDLMGPRLVNDLPKTVTVDNAKVSWTKPTKPIRKFDSSNASWDVDVLRGSRSFAFVYPSGDFERQITPGFAVKLNFYGSYEGLRLNMPITIKAIDKLTDAPLTLKRRNVADNVYVGGFYNVKITEVDKANRALKLTFSSTALDTPVKTDGNDVKLKDLSILFLESGVQPATKKSVTGVTLGNGGDDVIAEFSSSCPYDENNFEVCPAVGDIVNLTKANEEPLWGVVDSIATDPNNNALMTNFKVDKWREYPKPLRNIAHTSFRDPGPGYDNKNKVAYYGGEIVSNEFDGSVSSVSDELWFYDPAAADADTAWRFVSSGGPTPRSGGSLVYRKNSGKERLALFGGYYYQAVGKLNLPGSPACTDNFYLSKCFLANRPDARVAKRFPNDLWLLDLEKEIPDWSNAGAHADNTNRPDIDDSAQLQVRITSRFHQRSGKGDAWRPVFRVNGTPISLKTDPSDNLNSLDIGPSITGVAVGDEVSLAGKFTGTERNYFSAWGRVEEIADYNTIKLRVHGVKETVGTISLDYLDLALLNRLQVGNICTWDKDGGGANAKRDTCLTADPTGLTVGDAVVLEEYDLVDRKLIGSYAGYLSRLDNEGGSYRLFFVSSEDLAGLRDFAAASCDYASNDPNGCAGESVRNRPAGRLGAALYVEGENKDGYLWQGAQVASEPTPRFVETWKMDWNQTKWSLEPANLQAVPATGLILETLSTPDSANVFTTKSALTNPAIVPDKTINRTRIVNGQQVVEQVKVWDESKEWSIEIDNEGGGSRLAWNAMRLIKGVKITLSRVGTFTKNSKLNTSTEHFVGEITGLIFPGTGGNGSSHLWVKVKYAGGGNGLTGNSANARAAVYYPSRKDANALKFDATRLSDDVVTGLADPADQLPVGSLVAVYKKSFDFNANGQNSEFFTAIIDGRVPIISGGAVTSFQVQAAGPQYLSSPNPTASGLNGMIGTGNNLAGFHIGEFRVKGSNWTTEWFNKLADGQWKVQFSVPAANDRPGPRTGGTIAVTTSREEVYLTGGTIGSFASLWRLIKPDSANDDRKWRLAKADHRSNNDLPNVEGAAFDVLENKQAVVFGGRRNFSSKSPVGPKVLGLPYNTTANDGSWTMADSGLAPGAAGYKQSLFFDQTYSQAAGAAGRDSLKMSAGAASVNMDSPANGNTLCQYIGETICKYQSARHLGTLGQFGASSGDSLAILNPGSRWHFDGNNLTNRRSLLFGGPALSLSSTNNRFDQEGYYPSRCDNSNSNNCLTLTTYGVTTRANEEAFETTKSLLLAGFTRLQAGDWRTSCPEPATQCGSVLVTPVGVGRAIIAGQDRFNLAGGTPDGTGNLNPSYCADYTKDVDNNYSCKTSYSSSTHLAGSQLIYTQPDSEDLMFLFNASKILSGDDTYKITGYYGGVRRGFLVTDRSSTLEASGELDVKEIVP